jgi:16S rRNA (uracil1498-N3)-methyltransferase
VTEITKLADVVDALKSEGYDLILVPYEMEENVSIKCALKEMASVLGEDGRFSKIAVFIGPEGGFEADEVDLLVSRGARSVTIGENILRTETAGPAVIAMLMYELEL